VALPDRVARPPDALPVPLPDAFSDGFEGTEVGQPAQGPVTYGETATATIRVTDEAAATGSRSLEFVDAPGLDYAWNPHIWYTPGIPGGTVRARFSARLGPGSILYHEWRDDRSPYEAGPSLFIHAGGDLVASGESLVTVPTDTWFTVQVTYDVGFGASGLYDLEVTLPATGTQTFAGIGVPGETICGLDWLGFVSLADAATVLYLDDLSYDLL